MKRINVYAILLFLSVLTLFSIEVNAKEGESTLSKKSESQNLSLPVFDQKDVPVLYEKNAKGTYAFLKENKEKRILFLPKGVTILKQKEDALKIANEGIQMIENNTVEQLDEKYQGTFVEIFDFAQDVYGNTWIRGLYETGSRTPWILSENLPVFDYAKAKKATTKKKNASFILLEEDMKGFSQAAHTRGFHFSEQVSLQKGQRFDVESVLTMQEEVPQTFYGATYLGSLEGAGYFSSEDVAIAKKQLATHSKLKNIEEYTFSEPPANSVLKIYPTPESKPVELESSLSYYEFKQTYLTSTKQEIKYYVINIDGNRILLRANEHIRETYYSTIQKKNKENFVVQLKKDTFLFRSLPDSRKQDKGRMIRQGSYVAIKEKVQARLSNGEKQFFYVAYENNYELGYLSEEQFQKMTFKDTDYKIDKGDTFENLSRKYQISVEDLKKYNPEIFLYQAVRKAQEEKKFLATTSPFLEKDKESDQQERIQSIQQEIEALKEDTTKLPEAMRIYFYPRENISSLSEAANAMKGVVKNLELPATLEILPVLSEMLQLKANPIESSSKIVSTLGYLMPYIRYRGLLPSVAFAQAIIESGDGGSALTEKENNLFGYKGTYKGGSVQYPTKEYVNGKYVTVQATFRKYPTQEESIKDYLDLLEGYYGVKGIKDYVPYIQKVKAGGYATSPTYVTTLIATVKNYDLEKFDTIDFMKKEKEEVSSTKS